MQGNRGILDSFPETIDLNQGSISSNSSVDPTGPWDNMLNPLLEDRLSNSMLSSARENPGRANAVSHKIQNYSGWDQGESSSSANLYDHGHGSDLKMGHGWPSSSSDYAMTNPSLPNLAPGRGPINANLSGVYNHGDTRLVMRPSLSPTVYASSSRVEAGNPAPGASYDVGTSSGSFSYWAGTPDISGSSMDNWGLSCKRKALEGSSGQSCGGSSSSNAEPENIVQHNFPSRYNTSSGLNISAASDIYPPVSANGAAETYARNFGGGGNLGNQDTVTFGLPLPGSELRHSSVGSTLVPPRPISVTNSLGSRQPMSSGNHSGIRHVSGVPRGLHPVPWSVSANSRGGSSSSPNMVSGDRYAALQDEANFRSSTRNNGQPLPFIVAPETRNMVQDPTNWSLATSNVSYSRNADPNSGLSRGSSAQTFPTAWTPNLNSATSSSRNFSDFSPWTLLPPVESDSGSQRGHFSLLPSAPSVEEAEMPSRSSSRGNHQLHLRSTQMTDVAGNDLDGWRGLAADIEGRHRLIRQVLHAMRRGENTRSEDYMLFDPFLNGVAELHDRHRGMRLDVDNMSYEELLALEERIGNVNTGLSEETIWGHMKQRKHEPIHRGFSSNLEPCCICREEYTTGDDMGILDCGHEFHSSCIKQWLLLKNVCPICKMTALKT